MGPFRLSLFILAMWAALAPLVWADQPDSTSQFGTGPHRNNVAEGENLPQIWPRKPLDKWAAPLGSETRGSPVVAGGKVLIGTNNDGGYLSRAPSSQDMGVLLCFDEGNGDLLWQYCCAKLPGGKLRDFPGIGICSTPFVEEDRLWFVSSRAEVVCLDTEGFHDGQNDGPVLDEPAEGTLEADVVWRLDMMRLGVKQHNMANCSVTSCGSVLLVCTSNGVDRDHTTIPAPQAPSFLALEKASGKVIWSDNSPGTNILHGQWASPAVVTVDGSPQAVFAGGDGWLYSFAPLGDGRGGPRLLWKFDCNPKTSHWIYMARSDRNNLLATPVAYDQVILIGTGRSPDQGKGEGLLWCVDATRGRSGSDVSHQLGHEGEDRTPEQRRIQAVDPVSGGRVRPNPMSAERWRYGGVDQDGDGKLSHRERMHRTISSVAVKDDLVIAPDIAGVVHCLDATTGAPWWSCDVFAPIWASPLIAGERVVIADEDGVLSIFTLSRDPRQAMRILPGGKGVPVLQWEMSSAIYGTPALSKGVLFVATQDELHAIDLAGSISNGAPPPGPKPAAR